MSTKELKIYISADFEGISGVIAWDEIDAGKPDYDYFRKIMAKEVNAAVDAAFDFGATYVVVKDAHANARNILPTHLNKKALLLREWSTGPMGMMEGINNDYDAAMFIGYHAKAGTPDAPLKHTFSGKIFDFRVNGISLPEAGWNALIAGYYDVPVIFASGDKALCSQISALIDSVVTVSVKEGIGKATISLHPEIAQEQISKNVTLALEKKNQIKPFKLNPPYNLEIVLKDENDAYRLKWYPGAELVNSQTIRFQSDDFFDCLRFFNFV